MLAVALVAGGLLAAALGDSALQGQAAHRLGQAYYYIGDFGRAAELLRQNVEAADRESGTSSTDVQILSRAWLAWTLSELGAFAEGRRYGEEALRLAAQSEDDVARRAGRRDDAPVVDHFGVGNAGLVPGGNVGEERASPRTRDGEHAQPVLREIRQRDALVCVAHVVLPREVLARLAEADCREPFEVPPGVIATTPETIPSRHQPDLV